MPDKTPTTLQCSQIYTLTQRYAISTHNSQIHSTFTQCHTIANFHVGVVRPLISLAKSTVVQVLEQHAHNKIAVINR